MADSRPASVTMGVASRQRRTSTPCRASDDRLVTVPVITRFPLAPSTVGLMVVSVTATSSEVT